MHAHATPLTQAAGSSLHSCEQQVPLAQTHSPSPHSTATTTPQIVMGQSYKFIMKRNNTACKHNHKVSRKPNYPNLSKHFQVSFLKESLTAGLVLAESNFFFSFPSSEDTVVH